MLNHMRIGELIYMANHTVNSKVTDQVTEASNGGTSKYDWAVIKADYLANRHLTLVAIAEKYGCSLVSVKKHSGAERWIDERAALNREFIRSTTEANMRRQAKTALQFNEDCLAETVSLLSSLKNEHERLKAANELKASDISKMAESMEKLQRAGRLALGMSTSSGELSGKDGKPLMGEREKTLDEVAAELIAAIGEEAFNAINGTVTRSEHRVATSSADYMDDDEEDVE